MTITDLRKYSGKLPILTTTLLIWSSLAQAQEMKWDSTVRPDIYNTRVELFRSLPHARKDVVFLGNSITFWADWSELLGNTRYKNRGIPGDITFGVLERLDEVIQGKPAKVFILIGINDLARNIPDSVILQNYRRMVRRLKAGAPGTRIYFQTLLPTNDTFQKLKNHYNKEDHIRYLNDALKEMAPAEGFDVIDLHPHFVDEAGKLRKEYTWDGVHLTLAGYRKWAEVLRKGNYIK
ncbi:lysophospholipase L1-like esterase [Larkinella arboricola]|uniref:Lysophospholipase L1-like esterase n=1 Tax=Larkinella arboricola TaxID=643671 RepID=A0A327WQ91_LARAB|nr:GDSL-type esterase/lipase family protein [Larkinella arboricola]RAJ94528.1 lysophospholipase L1-like esterase [Larkinella arboricola]